MSQFSQSLESYILKSGMSYTEVAKRANIDRTQLMHMKKGARTGDDRALERLSEALMLGNAQKQELRRLYMIAKMGDNVYARRLLIKSLLEQMGRVPEALPLRPSCNSICCLDALPDYKAVIGCEAVSDLLEAAITQENARENAHVRVIGQPEETALINHLAAAGRSNSKMHIEHIVCFQQGVEKGSKNCYNIECFHQILPVFTSGCRYDSFYYYDEVSSRFGEASILPYLLLTSECCISFSKDLTHAQYSRLPDSFRLYEALFLRLKQHAKPMVTKLQNQLELMHLYFDSFNTAPESEKVLYMFFPVPCLAVFFDEELITRLIRPELPHVEEILAQYRQMLDNINEVMRSTHIVSYFTEAGINYFLQNGRIIEIPDDYYYPLTKNDRQNLLFSLLSYAEKGFYQPHLVDSSQFEMPRNLIVSALNADAVKLVYGHPQLGNLTFTVEEPSLSYAIYDFLYYLQGTRLVHTSGQTISLIKSKLSSFI